MFDFKGFISAILRKKSDDPVGSLKSATIWIQELPDNNVHQAQQEIVKTLAAMNLKNHIDSLKERIRVLLYLEEKATPLQEALCDDYLERIYEPKALEIAYLPTIISFWEEMATAYYQCIRHYAKNPSNSKLFEQIPLLTAKALHLYAMHAKWHHMRYLPVENKVWRTLHRLYLFAEREGFERDSLKIQAGMPDTTCTDEYVKPLMLELASPNNLLPTQIDMVDHWLESWSSNVVLEAAFLPHRQLFAVNTGDAKPAKKLRRNMEGEKYRYISTALLQLSMGKVVDQLSQGEIPARLKLGEACRLPACLELIETVGKRWAGKGTSRMHVRQPNVDIVQVLQGRDEILSQLRPGRKLQLPSADAEPVAVDMLPFGEEAAEPNLAPPPRQPALFGSRLKQWVIENESLSGLGATFNNPDSIPLKIGSIVGLKPISKKHFSIGVVRRISNEPSGKSHVGVQLVSHTPILVKLSTTHAQAAEQTMFEAAYLPDIPQISSSRSLLIRKEHYAPAKVLQLAAQGKAYTIRLRQILEQSEDYALANFEVMARQ
jgi:hypothetical protein